MAFSNQDRIADANPLPVTMAGGTSVIGKVGIDQTTPGTTNAVVATGNVAHGSTDSGNPVKTGAKFNSTLTPVTNGQRADAQSDQYGNLRIQLTATGGTGVDGIPNTSIAFTSNNSLNTAAGTLLAGAPYFFNGASWDRATKPNAVSRIASAAASTNATSAKASSGTVHSITAYNTTAAVKFLKLYNKASAPAVGTDTPFMTFAIPPNGTLSHTFQNGGLYVATGIAYALTGLAADADTTALVAGDVVGVNITYS